MAKTYTVETLRSGQPRAYADTEREYLVTITQDGKPYLWGGNLEKRIEREEADRAAGRMAGGQSPDQLRQQRREWAKTLIRALCQKFREKDDDDGRTGMAAHFYPTLKRLDFDDTAGTIRVFIVEPFTD